MEPDVYKERGLGAVWVRRKEEEGGGGTLISEPGSQPLNNGIRGLGTCRLKPTGKEG